jgi:hypothetical protein
MLIFIEDDYNAFINELHKELPKGAGMYKSKTGYYYYTNCSDASAFSDLDL